MSTITLATAATTTAANIALTNNGAFGRRLDLLAFDLNVS